MLPPHLEIEPVRRLAARPPRRLAALTTALAYSGTAAWAIWFFRAQMKADPPKAQKAPVELLILQEPAPAQAQKGSGATDPKARPDTPQPKPVEDFLHVPDRMPDREELAPFNPALPSAPDGDGRPRSQGGGGEGAGDVSLRGNGTLPMRVEDMDILWRVQPEYPLSVELSGDEDAGEVEVTIDERGMPIKVKALRFQFPACAKSAEYALKQWRFSPVKVHGVAVKAIFRVGVNFILPNKVTRR